MTSRMSRPAGTPAQPLRVLCVSPRFVPTNAADMHRLRLLLRHCRAAGWEAEVLAVAAADVPGPQDDFLTALLPEGLVVHRVRASLPSRPLATLALRAGPGLWRAGDRLLATGRFDLVFFSTTEFLVHLFGVSWRRSHGVPFCMDFQDPWVSSYYHDHPQVTPPGGRFKYALMSLLDRWAEARVVRACAGFLAVSASYVDALAQRYGERINSRPVLIRGFPGEPGELAAARDDQPVELALWRYIGRGGEDMHTALRGFLAAWARAGREGTPLPEGLRVEARGTAYAAGARALPTLQSLADAAGCAGFSEYPSRIPYREVLALLQRSGALVVFGSDDPAYTASKIYPYLLAGRPLLVICHRDSPLVALLQAVGGAICVTFRPGEPPAQLAADIFSAWFAAEAWRQPLPLDHDAFLPHTAARQAEDVGHWLRACVADAEPLT